MKETWIMNTASLLLGVFISSCTLITYWAVFERPIPMESVNVEAMKAGLSMCDPKKMARLEVAGFVFRINCNVEDRRT